MYIDPIIAACIYCVNVLTIINRTHLSYRQLPDANPGRPEDADGLLLENQVDREGRGDGRDQQDPGLPDDLDAAGAGGAGGGLALMADNRRGRDAVDYAYMLMMLVFLISIGYLTGSFYQFVIFFVGVTVILM